MRVALLHDYLTRLGGAERVFLNLRQIFKKADVFTLLYDPVKMEKYFPGAFIHTSFLQEFPGFWRRRHKYLLPFLPAAAESIDLRDYDLVISSSNSFIKGVITRPKTVHICYCHNPMRFAWDTYNSYICDQRKGVLARSAIRIMMHYIRMWDKSTADRVDYFIANSETTAARIRKYYGRDSKIIYPPVEVGDAKRLEADKSFPRNDYFLIVSQLTPYKRIDLAIETFNKLTLPLFIIGEGPERKRLEKMAGQNVRFLGFLPDEEIEKYFRNCKAFIFSGEDDFGIAPVEAMSYGKPVLAYRKGGATETILEGVCGEFFDDLVMESLADGVRRLLANYKNYDPLAIRRRSERFSDHKFAKNIKRYVIEVMEERKKQGQA